MEGLRSAGRSTTPSGVSWISRSLPACRPSRSRTGLGRITRPALSILSVIPLHDGTWHWQWQAELAIRAAKVPARTCRWSCMSDTANPNRLVQLQLRDSGTHQLEVASCNEL